MNAADPRAVARRTVLGGLGAGVIGGAALGVAATRLALGAGGDNAREADGARAAGSEAADLTGLQAQWSGAKQAGVDRPWTPQRNALMVVLDLPEGDLATALPALGRRIASLMSATAGDAVLPDGALGLTVTVGLGPHLVRRHNEGTPGSEPLPEFDSDREIRPEYLGGDLMLMLAADDPGILSPVSDELISALPQASRRWEQRGARSPSQGPRARNPLGFHDGVIVPNNEDELSENVWFGARNAQATICVVRRFRLDRRGFASLPLNARERAVGRDLDGVPLSGGKAFAEADLQAKTTAGDYLVPLQSHVRAAHPSFTGSALMLRRSYAYDNGGGDEGLLFISYQRELRTYVETQRRMDEVDDEMMRYARATASTTFLILPGYSAQRPLGSSLFPTGTASSSAPLDTLENNA